MATNNYSQIVNAGLLYCSGLNLVTPANATLGQTTIIVTDGQCRDNTNEIDIFVNTAGVGTIVSTAFVGLNGLDTGTVGVNSQYAVYVISDPLQYHPTAFLLSLSNSAPYLPTGYGLYNRIGWIFTDASGHIFRFSQSGTGLSRTYNFENRQRVLQSGVATVFTTVPLTGFVPTTGILGVGVPVYFNSEYKPATAGNQVAIAINLDPSTSVGTYIFTGQVTTQFQSNAFLLEALMDSSTGVPEVIYKVANASDVLNIFVSGFIDSL